MSTPFPGVPELPFNIQPPYTPPPAKPDIHKALASLPQPRKHYLWYFSSPSAASEMDNPQEDLGPFLRGYFHLKSADWEGNNPRPLKAWEATELEKVPSYYIMPLHATMRQTVDLALANSSPSAIQQRGKRWLPDADLDIYVREFGRTGFQGGLNYYRVGTDPAKQADVELFAGRKIDVPALYISGKQDWGMYQSPGAVERLGQVCTRFKGVEVVDGAGHWVQQEQPERVVELVLGFLKENVATQEG